MRTAAMIHTYPPPREKLTPMTGVRSTILVSGLAALRERGLYDNWAAALDERTREAITTTIAGVWMPIDVVVRHYRACEGLGLSHDDAFAIGLSVGKRVQATMLHLVRHVAQEIGVTPWTIGAQYDRIFSRMFEGGGFRMLKDGPKDAVIEMLQIPLAEFGYFRSAFCGVNQAGMHLFAARSYVRIIPGSVTDSSFAIRVQWV